MFSRLVQELTKLFSIESMPTSCKPILDTISGLDDEELPDHSTAFGGGQNM
jgi:hypothetical protein